MVWNPNDSIKICNVPNNAYAFFIGALLHDAVSSQASGSQNVCRESFPSAPPSLSRACPLHRTNVAS
jgi:hypothetical protein